MNLLLLENKIVFSNTETWLKTIGDEPSIVELTPITMLLLINAALKTERGAFGIMYRRDLFHAKIMSPLCEIKTLELLRMQMSSTSGRKLCINIVYRPPHCTKLYGTETGVYSDIDILFTEARWCVWAAVTKKYTFYL